MRIFVALFRAWNDAFLRNKALACVVKLACKGRWSERPERAVKCHLEVQGSCACVLLLKREEEEELAVTQ